jgi:predicted phosphodiesterase
VKIALIADIHEDAESLKQALTLIEKEKCDEVICLGDILGYSFARANYQQTRNASECISLIRSNCTKVLLGNHDLFHLGKLPAYGYGFDYPENWYALGPEEKLRLSNGRVWNYTDDYPLQLSEREKAYLWDLPEFLIHENAGIKILLSHFLYPNFTGYEWNPDGKKKMFDMHFGFLRQNSCQLSICGHTHIEGLGIFYDPQRDIYSKIFKGYRFYHYGKRKIKSRYCSITIPALADNKQANGFAIYNSEDHTINTVSLNINRRFV